MVGWILVTHLFVALTYLETNSEEKIVLKIVLKIALKIVLSFPTLEKLGKFSSLHMSQNQN